jgi:DNA repair protein RadC
MPRDGDSRIHEPSLTRWDPDGLRRIRQLPRVDRPREKLLARGAESLSDVELLAVLLGCGTKRLGVLELASRVLRETEGQPNPDVSVLRAIHGLGEAKACQVASALELGRRWFRKARPIVRHASDALPYLQEIRGQKQEHFVCLSLSGANEVIASRVVTVGLLDTNQVHPREVFADPIADRAASVLLAHNHPSGTLEASPEDIALTRRLVQAGQLLGIRVLDHLIVTAEGFVSLKQEGHI